MTLKELLARRDELNKKREATRTELYKINDKAKAEKRELTPAEEIQFKALQREMVCIDADSKANEQSITEAQNQVREIKSKNVKFREFLQKAELNKEYVVERENTTTASVPGVITQEIMPIVEPLEKGLIYDKVGVTISSGVVGQIQWPFVGAVEAAIAGEAVKGTETEVNISKVNAIPVRLTVGAFVSNQAISQSTGDLVAVVTDQFVKGLQRVINRVMFSFAKYNTGFFGPFAGAKSTGTFAEAVPTYAELLKMKGDVANEGCDMSAFCYVMSEAMKAQLEATPRAAGTGEMICVDGRIGGYPVFCTQYVNENASKATDTVEHVVAGAFNYLALNQHGALRLTIESDGQADGKKIWLNSDWSMTTLYNQAFSSWKCKGV